MPASTTSARVQVLNETEGFPEWVQVDAYIFGCGDLASRPASGANVGDMYVVLDTGLNIFRFDLWDGTAWQDMSGSGGGITESQHRALDQLVHDIAEDAYTEYTYGLFGRLDNETTWTDSGKTTKIRETQFTYTGTRVTEIVTIQYDAAGLEVERVTDTITYAFPFGNRIDSIDSVKLP